MNAKDIQYRLILKRETGDQLNLTGVVSSMSWEEQPEELAMRATFTIINTKYQNEYLSSIIKLCTGISIYANQGNGWQQVFNGLVWDWSYSSPPRTISITAYDRLIYLKNSKDNLYFPAGTSTVDVIQSICKDWSIPLNYEWESITHTNLKFPRMRLSDIIVHTLKEAQIKLGNKYVFNYNFSDESVTIKKQGCNKEIYVFQNDLNTISTDNRLTLDKLVTEVWVTGREDNGGRIPIEAKSYGNISFGTLREIIVNDEDSTLGDAQAQSDYVIKDRGKPTEDISIHTIDIPILRRGDRVKVEAGNLIDYFHVLGVSHDAVSKTMKMNLERVDGI